MEGVRKVSVGPASGDRNGPDLALAILHPIDSSDLGARMSFYDLPKRRSQILPDPPPIDHGGWILTGIVSEWTTIEEGHRGYRRVPVYSWVSGGGGVRGQQRRGEFDYLDFEARRNEKYTGPESFEGMSGGGL
jgi:hypothetical protein